MTMTNLKEIKDYLINLYATVNNVDESTVKVVQGSYLPSMLLFLKKDECIVDYIDSDFDDAPLIYDDYAIREKDAEIVGVFTGITAISIHGYTIYSFDNSDRSFSVIDEEAFQYLTNLLRSISTPSKLPEKGIHKADVKENRFTNEYSLEFKEVTEIPSTNISHPVKDLLEKDIEFFFNNVELFSRYNQKPLRKYLLTGEPGTGKTSICYNLANMFSDIPVIFVTDFSSLQEVCKLAAKEDKKVIVVYEDCECTMSRARNNSNVLNFFDGVDRPNIKSGGVIVMTTNHPEQIETRISKRPGRIDRIFHVNNLKDKFAYEVFVTYFKEFMEENKFDYTTDTAVEAIKIISDRMTGAQIKELFNSYVCYMVSNNKKFDLYDVNYCKEQMFEAFNKIDDEDISLDDIEEVMSDSSKQLREVLR